MASLTDLLPAETASPAETEALGAALAAALAPGDVVALYGDLGAGKTHLAKGVAAGLGLDPDDVTSPTFTIAQEHDGLLHVDLYRVELPEHLARLGLDEWLSADAVVLVEWPERAEAWLPPDSVRLRLTHLGGDRRRIELLP
jgi:tRNA threonylcarbamoyladenosine biosynthesis protein TsaE